MVVFLLHTESVSGSSPLSTTKFAPVVQWTGYYATNVGMEVRFLPGAPILGCVQQTLYI